MWAEFPLINEHLTLRSGPQDRVSKGGAEHRCCPSFETPRGVYPEVFEGRGSSG
jgi:hypothetical protein